MRNFYNKHSAVKAGNIHSGESNLLADWNRLLNSGQATLNGKPLAESAKAYLDTQQQFTNAQLVRFFREVLLGKIEGDTTKTEDFLKDSLHQGALMYPVSAPFTNYVHEQVKGLQPASTGDHISKKVNFVTTDKGFVVQEIYEAKEFRAPMDANSPDSDFPLALKDIMTEDCEIKPDKGNEFVVRAQATVEVDFSKDLSSPEIKVKSNTISYGSKAVEKFLDTRNLLHVILDFFKNLFGVNKVKDLTEDADKSSYSGGMQP